MDLFLSISITIVILYNQMFVMLIFNSWYIIIFSDVQIFIRGKVSIGRSDETLKIT